MGHVVTFTANGDATGNQFLIQSYALMRLKIKNATSKNTPLSLLREFFYISFYFNVPPPRDDV